MLISQVDSVDGGRPRWFAILLALAMGYCGGYYAGYASAPSLAHDAGSVVSGMAVAAIAWLATVLSSR